MGTSIQKSLTRDKMPAGLYRALNMSVQLASLGLAALVLSQTASAATMPSTTASNLSLCGQGNLVVTGKTAGKAALFLPNCKQDWRAQPMRMRFSYQANIPGWAFKKAANILLERNVSAQQWKINKSAYQAFTANYQAIKAGDVYELNYQPDQQLMSLTLNQKQVAQVKNAAFVDYFLIWLGNKPFNAELKKQLLPQ